MRHAAALLLALLCAPLVLHAQSGDPAACSKDANDWFNVAYRAARDSAALPGGKPADTRGLLATRTTRTKECAAKFNVDAMSGAALIPLSSLYSSIGMDSLAAVAVDKRLAEPGLNAQDKAGALLAKINSLTKPDTLVIVRAEPYMAMLDAMPDAVILEKLEAHQRLNGEYRYLDVNNRIRQHSLAIIAIGKHFKAAPSSERNPPAGTVSPFALLSAYANLAEVYADFGQVDSTLATLRLALVDHPEIAAKDADAYLTPERERYELVGKHAMSLGAGHWLNVAPGTKSLDPTGKVTVVEFTAHWCIPCRNSYPAMTAMAERFAKQGVQFAFATEFYGYLGAKQNLSAAQEFEADREYFIAEHDIRFPVAISDRPATPKAGDPYVREPNSENYKVGGIPQTVIIDKNGVIRRILTGWDTGNAERMPVLIDQLLKEKPARVTPP